MLALIKSLFLTLATTLLSLFPHPKISSPLIIVPTLPPIKVNLILKPSSSPTLTQKIIKPTKIPTTAIVRDTTPWGVAQQINEDTWTMKIGQDSQMATINDTLNALNVYRTNHDVQKLTLDPTLTKFAQDRADYLASIKSTDEHKGFIDYLENHDGYNQLGFTWLGENISYGYRLIGVHLIEWLFAGDEPHNTNQLNSRWNYVSIGINGTAVSIIFATGKR